MARRKTRSNKNNQTRTTTNKQAKPRGKPIRNDVRRGINSIFEPTVVRQERIAAPPPERALAQRKKSPNKTWSENLRIRCKDRPTKNTPTGGSGSKKYVPWC